MSGLFFEEFEEGKEFNRVLSHIVTEMDNVMFCTMYQQIQKFHSVPSLVKVSIILTDAGQETL